MQVEVKTEGGVAHFPGLSRPQRVSSEQLTDEQSRELERLVGACRFFDLPEAVGTPAPGAADYQQHTITVEDSGRSKSVRVVDPIERAELRDLLNYVRTLVREIRGRG